MTVRTALVAAAALLVVVAGVVRADTSATIYDAPTTETVGFSPPVIETPAGNWVTWSNAGEDAHTVTARDGTFDSGYLLPSEGFSWFFDQEGTYEYVCVLHPWMVAQVVVGGGAGSPPEPVPEPEPEPEPEMSTTAEF